MRCPRYKPLQRGNERPACRSLEGISGPQLPYRRLADLIVCLTDTPDPRSGSFQQNTFRPEPNLLCSQQCTQQHAHALFGLIPAISDPAPGVKTERVARLGVQVSGRKSIRLPTRLLPRLMSPWTHTAPAPWPAGIAHQLREWRQLSEHWILPVVRRDRTDISPLQRVRLRH